jgi:hypothetical protein
MEIVMVKSCELRTYEYHIEGADVVKVYNHQEGRRVEMPFRKNKARAIHENKKGKYIKLDSYKHYIK